MVQLNKDEHVWVCFEIARVQNAHAVQRLWSNLWPGKILPKIHAVFKNYRKYRQHCTSLNRNKVNSGRYLWFLVTLLSKEKLKIKRSGFSRPLHSVFCNSQLSQFLSDFEKLGVKRRWQVNFCGPWSPRLI